LEEAAERPEEGTACEQVKPEAAQWGELEQSMLEKD
jgi:hypothetical protein